MLGKTAFLRFFGVSSLLLLPLFASSAYGCPLVGGLIDLNCDGEHRIVVVGDSVVYGVGDTLHSGKGGYVRLTGLEFSSSRVVGLGYTGIRSWALAQRIGRRLAEKRNNPVREAILGADVVIIDVGRNDFWENRPVADTLGSIQRIVLSIRDASARSGDGVPIVALAKLIPTARPFQNHFLDKLNRGMVNAHSDRLPVRVNFSSLPQSILSRDGVHPSSTGYEAIANVARRYITGPLQRESHALRPDGDHDGVYDLFERNRYHTNPRRADSDSDGLTDGVEIFSLLTNPLKVDTDGDGVADGAEVVAGTDPREKTPLL